MKKLTVILYDAGFKDSAPALLSLKNQSILSDIEVIWLEYGNSIFKETYKYPFIKKVILNMEGKTNITYNYNVGLSLATGKYFILIDPCLYFTSKTLEMIYEFHEKNPNHFTFNQEYRGKDDKKREYLTYNHPENFDEVIENDNIKIKNNNMGCMSCALTQNFKDVNGFDVFNNFVVTNYLNLCLIRMTNKFGLVKTKLDNPPVFHPWHPRKSKKPDEKKFMIKLNKKFQNEKIINAERGLSYINNNFELVEKENVWTLVKKKNSEF